MDVFLNTNNLFFFVDAKIFIYIYYNLRQNCMSKTSLKPFLQFLFPFETQSYLENTMYVVFNDDVFNTFCSNRKLQNNRI